MFGGVFMHKILSGWRLLLTDYSTVTILQTASVSFT